MGKWCYVRCNCPNRRPSDPNRPLGEYECGHAEGAVIGVWPGYFFNVGEALASLTRHEPQWAGAFEVFARLADRGSYVDEYLALSPAESDLWRLELEELLAIEARERFFPRRLAQRWTQHWTEFFSDPWHQRDAGSLRQVLRGGLALCEASETTGNPIEFYL